MPYTWFVVITIWSLEGVIIQYSPLIYRPESETQHRLLGTLKVIFQVP
jgi:hypothetical protein